MGEKDKEDELFYMLKKYIDEKFQGLVEELRDGVVMKEDVKRIEDNIMKKVLKLIVSRNANRDVNIEQLRQELEERLLREVTEHYSALRRELEGLRGEVEELRRELEALRFAPCCDKACDGVVELLTYLDRRNRSRRRLYALIAIAAAAAAGITLIIVHLGAIPVLLLLMLVIAAVIRSTS